MEPRLPRPREALLTLRGEGPRGHHADVRLNLNEWAEDVDASPFLTPEDLRELRLNRYPDGRARTLRAALADLWGVRPQEVLAGNGSMSIILDTFLAYGGPGRTVLLFSPTYPLYARLVTVLGMNVATEHVGLPYLLDAARVRAAVWLSGDWKRTVDMWEELQRRFSGEDVGEIVPDTGPIAAAIALERDGPRAAGPALHAATDRQARSGTWRARFAAACHLANLQLARGRPGEVVADLGGLLAQRSPQALELPLLLLAVRVALPAALLTGDTASLQPWRASAQSLRGDGAMFAAAMDHADATDAASRGDTSAAQERLARAAQAYERLGWRHLAAEPAWQRAALGDRSALGAAAEFYAGRGADWRTRWLGEERWR